MGAMLQWTVANKSVEATGTVGEGKVRMASSAAGTGVAIHAAAAVAVVMMLAMGVTTTAAAGIHSMVMTVGIAGAETNAAWGRGAALVLGHCAKRVLLMRIRTSVGRGWIQQRLRP